MTETTLTDKLVARLRQQAEKIEAIEIPDRGDDAKKKAWAKRREQGETLDAMLALLDTDELKAVYEATYPNFGYGPDVDKAGRHVKEAAQEALRLRLQDPEAVARITEIVGAFNSVVKHPKGWEYAATRFDSPEDIFIAVYREKDGFPTELHLLNSKGEWAGPSCTIYSAEERYSAYSKETNIRPATVGASSSQLATTHHARAQAAMIAIAADLADLYTQRDMPVLQYEVDVAEAYHATKKKEADAKRAADLERAGAIWDAVAGHVARVTLKDKKTPYTGALRRVQDTSSFELEVSYKPDPIKVPLDRITKVEVKLNGRFTEVIL